MDQSWCRHKTQRNEFLIQDVEAFVDGEDQLFSFDTKYDLAIDESKNTKESLWINQGIIIEPAKQEFIAPPVQDVLHTNEREIKLCTEAGSHNIEGEESKKRSDPAELIKMNNNSKPREQSLGDSQSTQIDKMNQKGPCQMEVFSTSGQESFDLERDDEKLSCSDSSSIEYSRILSEPIPSDTPTTIKTVSTASAQDAEYAKRLSTPPIMSQVNGQSADSLSHNGESVYGAASKFCFMSIIIFGLKTLAYVLLGLADCLAANDSYQSKPAIVQWSSSDRDETRAVANAILGSPSQIVSNDREKPRSIVSSSNVQKVVSSVFFCSRTIALAIADTVAALFPVFALATIEMLKAIFSIGKTPLLVFGNNVLHYGKQTGISLCLSTINGLQWILHMVIDLFHGPHQPKSSKLVKPPDEFLVHQKQTQERSFPSRGRRTSEP